MSVDENAANEPGGNKPEQGSKRTSAFEQDKKFGNRLDRTVAIGENFLLLGAVADEPVDTVYGLSDSAKLLLQKINPETGAPQGPPIRAVTVLSAVVEKVMAITPEELAAGPIVKLDVVAAKNRGGKPVTVLSWVRNLADEDDFSEFGLDPAKVGAVTELALPKGERIPY